MNILTVMNRTLQCASFKFFVVSEMSGLHTEYTTAGEQLIDFFDQWKFRLIIQKVNKTQLKLCVSAIQGDQMLHPYIIQCQACIQNTLQLENNSHHFFDQWKFRLIIQKVNKIQLKICVSAIETLFAFITCSSTPKAVKGTPQKQTHENGANFFSPLGGKKKIVALSTLLLLKLRDQVLRPCMIQTASNCVALKATGVHTNPQKDAATNPPIQARKNTVICVQE